MGSYRNIAGKILYEGGGFAVEKAKIKLGVAPTRDFAFNKEEAQKYKVLILDKIKAFGAEVVDMDDINNEGLLYDFNDLENVADKFKNAGVDGVFFPHVTYGTEHLVARVSKAVGKPVLIWGPRDEAPLEGGYRPRDSQCGLFATGKVLRRFNIPFTYIVNSRIEDKVFEQGYKNFIAVCSAVNAFKKIRILQIAPRPADFWSVICNEGELLEKFGIQTYPITLHDVAAGIERVLKLKGEEYNKNFEYIISTMDCSKISSGSVEKIAALKTVMKEYCEREKCTAVIIQCWSAIIDMLGIMTCIANGMMTEEGIPTACESDMHGAVSSILLQEAAMRTTPVFFTDITNRHPENDNGELLWHCGNFAASLAKEGVKREAGHDIYLPPYCPGNGKWEIKGGDITICRFDGDHGEYSLLIGEGKGIDGPKTSGSYVWFGVKDWLKWEEKIVEGPYIQHCAAVHKKVAPVLYEACKYIPGLKADPVEPSEEEIKQWLRGR